VNHEEKGGLESEISIMQREEIGEIEIDIKSLPYKAYYTNMMLFYWKGYFNTVFLQNK